MIAAAGYKPLQLPPSPFGPIKPSAEQLPAGGLDQNKMYEGYMQQWGDVKFMNSLGMGLDLVDKGIGLLNNYWAYDLSMRQFQMYENIANARIGAEKEIAGFQKELGLQYLSNMKAADERMNGPDGVNVRVAKLQYNNDLEKHRLTLEAQKEMAALKNLDGAFGMRGNYDYGLPVLT